MNTPRMSSPVSRLTRFSVRLALLACVTAAALTVEAQNGTSKKNKPRTSVTAKSTAVTAQKEKKVMITGSRIPRTVKSGTPSTDVELTVAVIEKRQIDQMGGTSLTDTLRKRAFGR